MNTEHLPPQADGTVSNGSIVGRLNDWPATGNGDGMDAVVVKRLMREAGAEIERLQADRETYNRWADEIKAGVAELKAEIERLTKENEELRNELANTKCN